MKKDLRQALLSAALAELRAHGAGSVSLRRIASRAGVSQAVPYRHFRDKNGLLAEPCWEGQEELMAHLRRARERAASGVDLLDALGVAYLESARKNPLVFQLMFSERGMRR